MPAKPYKMTPKNKAKFIEVLREKRSVAVAAEAIGVSRTQCYKHKKEDPEFSDAWDEAWETVIDDLEQSAMERAIEGYDEPIYYQDKFVDTRKRFEPQLTMFMLKANRDKYKDKVAISVTAEEYAQKVRETLAAQDEAAQTPVTDEDIDP